MSRPHPLVRLTGLAIALAVGLGGLLAIGDRIPTPPVSVAVERWTAWFTQTGPPGTVMGLVRTVAGVVLAYLLLVVLGEIVGRAASSTAPAVLRLVRQASPPTVTGLVQRVAGVGLAASAVAALVNPGSALAVTPGRSAVPPAAVAPAATAPADPPVVMTVTGSSVAGSGPPVMHVLGAVPASTTTSPASPSTTTTTTRPPGPSSSAAPGLVGRGGSPEAAPGPRSAPPAATPVAPPSAEAAVWVIAPGDHLWRVSRETLRAAWNRVPTDTETARYLQAVVNANRALLVVPGDADLVYPGQRFTLPSVPTG